MTINLRVPDAVPVRAGGRVPLRLINAANARIFAPDFGALTPQVNALDGQPVTPHAAPGATISVTDWFFALDAYALVDVTVVETPLRDALPDWSMELAANPLRVPDLARARRHEVPFTGGMMGGMVERQMGLSSGGGMGGMMGGGVMNRMQNRGIWFVNGAAAESHIHDSMLTQERVASHVIALTNATAFHRPIRLHVHSFRVLSRDGTPTAHHEWQDTVLVGQRERVEIAYVAENPGDWMFHCHILEHQAGGMMRDPCGER